MDSPTLPFNRYRPRPAPKPTHVRPSSREAVLEALEYGTHIPRPQIREWADVGDTTLRNTIRQLSREGVLTSQSGRNGAAVSVARYPVLPVVEITSNRMVWRLCDTLGGSVFATVRSRGKFRSPEDDFTALMGQASAILGAGGCGLPHHIPLQPPVLLCPCGEDCSLLPVLLPLMTPPPARILSPEEAVALELPYLPAAREAEVLLHVHTSVDNQESDAPKVTLFSRLAVRDLKSPFVPSPIAPNLSRTLCGYLENYTPYTPSWWKQLAAFLGDLGRFVRLSCVILEVDRPQEHAALLRSTLPTDTKLIRVRYAHNTPPLSHRGALRLTRRALWRSMEEETPP